MEEEIRRFMSSRKATIYLLCSPNLGVLDNWLPVLVQIYRSSENYRFVLLLPNLTVVSSIHFDNAINEIADSIFDLIVFQNIPGEWLKADSLANTKEWARSNYRITRIFEYVELIEMRHPKVYKLISPFISLYGSISKYKHRQKIFHIDEKIHDTDALLYDIHVNNHENVSQLLSIFESNLRFSMPHGIGIKLKLDHISAGGVTGANKLQIYLFSSFFERDYYIKKYGVNSDNLNFFGIPRHDLEWINEIQNHSQNLSPNFQDGESVFIISAPISTYLPRDRKVKSLKDIKKIIIENLDMNLVIKLHPKEYKEGVYEEVFGIKNYGRTWIYSDLHPFALAKGRRLTISLFSGVSFDMLRLGVPCIEYINLQNIPGVDIINGKPLTPLARYNFVTSASDYNEFKFQVNRIIKSSNYVMPSIKKYSEYFSIDGKSSSRVASNIIQLISDNNL
jgi:hypothetical protein